MHMVQRCPDIMAFSWNTNHLIASGFSSLKVFSVVFTYTDSTLRSTISDVSCPLPQVVQLLLIPGGWFPMPWVPMATTGRAFGFQWSTAVYWSMRGRCIAIRSQDARRPDGFQNLPYKRMGPENHLDPNLFLICGCESWVDFFVKLGPS